MHLSGRAHISAPICAKFRYGGRVSKAEDAGKETKAARLRAELVHCRAVVSHEISQPTWFIWAELTPLSVAGALHRMAAGRTLLLCTEEPTHHRAPVWKAFDSHGALLPGGALVVSSLLAGACYCAERRGVVVC